MKLKDFIFGLEKIKKEHGEDMQVVMADNIAVVEPVFSDNFLGEKVIITDQK
ncbi:MAG: hypothetical protein WC238_05290 [Parcubacteria group bacterium]|jgi:hypothetical protein